MSRVSVVGMLVAVEVLIAGMALYVIGGHGWAHGSFGLHQASFNAVPIAPLAAGNAPRVVIDDASTRVIVTPSTDGLVHVTDLTHASGLLFGSIAHIRVTRIPGGVRIERPGSDHLNIDVRGVGVLAQRLAVAVPSAGTVDIERCSGAEVTGITGGTSVRSVDGSITLANLGGAIRATSSDGSIDVRDTHAGDLTVRTSDGRVTLDNITANSVTAHSDDGSIRASTIALGPNANNELSTGDGSIHLALAAGANLEVDASTSDGSITVDGSRTDGDDSAVRTLRLGNAGATLNVSSGDGSIHITTNGAVRDNG